MPEDDGSGDADGGHEGVRAAIVAGVDAAPVLELAEHILDAVTLAVELPVVRDWHLAVDLGRDARLDATLGQGLAQPVGVIPRSPSSALALGSASSINAAPL